MQTRILRTVLFAAAAFIVVSALPLPAHHSYASFDTTVQKTIEGVIFKVDWTNPHIWVWMDVPGEKGATTRFGFEGMSPNFLSRRGWEKDTLKPGDKVSVVFNPFKNPAEHGGMFIRTTIGGKTLTGGGGTNAK
jgi:hypothetical protein